MKADEAKLEELIGGPLDGLTMQVKTAHKTIWINEAILREHGVPGDEQVCYKRGADRRFYHSHTSRVTKIPKVEDG
jgi:hypothetical protein